MTWLRATGPRLLTACVVALAALMVAAVPAAAGKAPPPPARGRAGAIYIHHKVDIRTLPAARPGAASVPPVTARSRPRADAPNAGSAPSAPSAPKSVIGEGGTGRPLAPAAIAAPDGPTPMGPTPAVRQLTEFPGAGANNPTPPDTTIGVGPSDVFEMVNSTWHRFDKSGNQLQSGNESDFFGPPTIAMITPRYTDARVVFDALSGRFYASVLIFDGCNPAPPVSCTSSNRSETDLAVSASSSPVGWVVYVVHTTLDNTLLDQPKLGFSSDKIVMTENETGDGGPFQFIVIQKSDVLAAVSPAATFFFALDNDHFNTIPAISLSATSTEFAMSAVDEDLTVFQFTGTPATNDVALSTTDFSIQDMDDPPLADQPSDTRQLDTGLSGTQSVVWQNGTLVGAGNDDCTPPNDTTDRPCLRFDNVSTSGGLNLVQDIDIGRTGADIFYPAVTLDPFGNLWYGHSTSSATQFASATEVFVPGGIFPAAPGLVPASDYAVGVGPYDCTFCTAANGDPRDRWGDYSAAAQDPSDPDDIWLAEELGSTSTTNTNSWGTAIARYTVSPPTTTTVSSSANPSVFGQPVTLTATVASPGGTPGGTVSFADNGNPLGTAILVNGVASVKTSTLGTGGHTITAAYPGDGTFEDSSGKLLQIVGQASTTTTLSPSANPSSFGQPIDFTAFVNPIPPGAGTPTGSVQFTADGVQFGPAVALFLGKATSSAISSLGPGSHTISAFYGGDSNFLASSGSMSQTVTCQVTISGQFNGTLTVTKSTCASNATVNGNIVVQTGGSLSLGGTHVNGSITTTGAAAVRLCGDTVNGPISISTSAGPVLLGDAADDGAGGCAGSLVSGGMTLLNNHAGAEIGGNTLFGNLVLNGTTGSGPTLEDGAPEVEANKIQGTLSCAGNSTAPTNDGQPNTVSGARSGQCGSAGF